ncbi:hypothetical protein Misp01_57200 [Microtetraspora sp. NBRC 13810]|nr:hypothetical protein Misp01_57200 [Microtetraspora sp. NBRC 13810]
MGAGRHPGKGGYFPVPPMDHFTDLRPEMVRKPEYGHTVTLMPKPLFLAKSPVCRARNGGSCPSRWAPRGQASACSGVVWRVCRRSGRLVMMPSTS